MTLKLSLMLSKQFWTLTSPSTCVLQVDPRPQNHRTCSQIHRVLEGWAPHLNGWPLKFLQLHGLSCTWQKIDLALSPLKIETSKLKGQTQGAPVNTRSCFSLSITGWGISGHHRVTYDHLQICKNSSFTQLLKSKALNPKVFNHTGCHKPPGDNNHQIG